MHGAGSPWPVVRSRDTPAGEGGSRPRRIRPYPDPLRHDHPGGVRFKPIRAPGEDQGHDGRRLPGGRSMRQPAATRSRYGSSRAGHATRGRNGRPQPGEKPGGTPCPQIGRGGVAGSWERVMGASGVTGGVVAASLRVTPLRMARRHSRRCRAYAVRHARPHPCRGRRGSTWQREQGVGVLLTAVRSTSPIGGLSISTTGDPQDPHARRAALPGGPPIASILVSVLVLVACQKSSHMV